jgi:hypothetical protein
MFDNVSKQQFNYQVRKLMIGCTILRAVSSVIAGGTGVGSGYIPRAKARATSSALHSSVVGTSATAPSRLCGPSPRAGQAQPGRSLPSAIGPGRLVGPEPVAPLASSQYSASVRGGLPTLLLSPLAGIGHCPLAIGHGPSAGLLVGVLDCGPVSPLSSPRACSGSGASWLARLRVDRRQRRSVGGSGAVALGPACALSAGPSPWWRIASGARLRRSLGHRAGRDQSAGPSSPARVRLVSGGQSLSGLRPLGSS